MKYQFRRFLPLLLLITLTIFGGFIFQLIESPNELAERDRRKADLFRMKENVGRKVMYIYENRLTPDEAKRWTLNHILSEAYNEEHRVGVDEFHTKWSFWRSLAYSIGLYTTIGSSYQTPSTPQCRVISVFYALFMIPLAIYCFLFITKNSAETLLKSFAIARRSKGCFWLRWTRLILPESYNSLEKLSDEEVLAFPFASMLILLLAWFLTTAALFAHWEEEWSFESALYFAFMTYTTIGLGMDSDAPKREITTLAATFTLVHLLIFGTTVFILRAKFKAMVGVVKTLIDQDTERVGMVAKMVYPLGPGAILLYKILPWPYTEQIREHIQARDRIAEVQVQTEESVAMENRFSVLQEI